jgi:hypothetical protein
MIKRPADMIHKGSQSREKSEGGSLMSGSARVCSSSCLLDGRLLVSDGLSVLLHVVAQLAPGVSTLTHPY